MKVEQRIWVLFVSLVLGMAILAGTAGSAAAYTVSGFVNYSGTQTGRIYIGVQQQYGSTGLGVSVPAKGPFTIRGVPNGTYYLQAFMDTQVPEAGILHASDPVGMSATIQVNGGDVQSGADIFLNDAVGPDLQPPQGANMMAGNGLTFVMWEPARNNYGAEVARYYTVYWSDTPNPGPTNYTGHSPELPSTDKGGYLATGLTNGNTYYFAVTAKLVSGGTESTPTNATDFNGNAGITIGPAPSGYTVSGTVDTTGIIKNTPNPTPLWVAVAVHHQGPVAFAYIPNPTDIQAFSISGVPAGTYDLYAILDMNNNGIIDVGDYMTGDNHPASITVANANVTNASFALSPQIMDVSVTTAHWKNGTNQGYNLNFNASALRKLPVNVSVSGPQLSNGNPSGVMDLAADYTSSGSFRSQPGVTSRPVVSPNPDTYSFTVTYADGSSTGTSPLTASITGVLDNFATPIYPTGSTALDSTSPTFSWRTPAPFPAGYYDFSIQGNFNNDYVMPKTQLSLMPQSTVPTGSSYYWATVVEDAFGNQAQVQTSFTPQASGPSITGISPVTGPAGTSVTITGNGFDTTTKSNNVVSFGGVQATNFTVNSATQITAVVPTGAPAGPVTVKVSGIATASSSFFTPTLAFTSGVADSVNYPTVPVAGATMSLVGSSPLISTTSDSTGAIHFANSSATPSGIAAGVPFSMKISAPATGPYAGYADVYSHVMSNANDIDTTFGGVLPYSLYSFTDLAGMGVQSGKGAIKSMVLDGAINTVSGAAVSVVASKLHPNTPSPYTVAYWNGTGWGPSTSGTGSDGRFVVLNVDDGDVVALTATKPGGSFTTMTYETHANAVNEGSIKVVPVISSFSPTSGSAGQTVTINGSGFDYSNCANNTVKFAGVNASVSSCASDGTQLVVTVPTLTQTLPLTTQINVATRVASSSSSSTFTVTATGTAPTISFSPTSGPVGIQVTISGSNFDSNPANNTVTFNGVTATVTSASSNQLVVNVPAGATSGPISVTTAVGTITSGAGFTVMANVPGTASGTYTFDSGTGLLSLNWTNTNFVCDGPKGTESEAVTTLTDTTLTWVNTTDTTNTMTWTRTSGTSGSILGTWSTTDSSTGNSYTATFNSDGTVSVSGTIYQCGGGGGGAPPSTFTVTVSSNAGGLVTTKGSQSIPGGATGTFTIIPVPGYHVVSVTGCGGYLAGIAYTTAPMNGDCTITAQFAKSDVVFDDFAYLLANPDVAAVVKSGGFTSGWEHYNQYGRNEGRPLTPAGYGNYREFAYLLANPDVAAAVKAGVFGSGWEHYNQYGRNEGRPLEPAGYANYSEEAYLAANPDVAAVVKSGGFTSGWEHYSQYGRNEGRPLSPVQYGTFSEEAYLLANPDVAAVVKSGGISSGWEHYNQYGRNEGRPVAPAGYVIYNEAAYLAANPDVAQAVKSGVFDSGWTHYSNYGKNEGRPEEPAAYANFDEGAYLDANPDVAQVVLSGALPSGWEHYRDYGRNEGRPLNLANYGSFNESDYLAANPDIFQALLSGSITSGWDHYSNWGKNEGRKLLP